MAKVRLTIKRISELVSGGPNRSNYLWDSDVAGLGVRAIGDKKYYLIQTRWNKKAVQIKMGAVDLFTVESARTEAKRLLLLIEQGIDPREQKRQLEAEQVAVREARELAGAAELARTLLIADVWSEYIEERKPYWGHRHYLDHIRLAQPGGAKAKKGDALLKPGPLAPLMKSKLSELSSEQIETWLKSESATRPSQTRLAFTSFRTFLVWCAEDNRYKHTLPEISLTGKVRSVLPKKSAKDDSLQKEQLPSWFTSVRQIGNPVIASYLQALLLTGARREELAGLRWEDVDFRWKSLTIKDKVEGLRVIPLTPYVESLLHWLPKRNQWVFSSLTAASGRIQEPRIAHKKAMAIAGIDGLTLHGLRRSFGSLCEWIEVPVGIVAQIMGHKPSATAERHYRVRPLDLLRMWHTKIEEWILEQAGIALPIQQEQKETLRLAAGGTKEPATNYN